MSHLRTIEVFKTGRHTAMNGETLNFTRAELRDIAKSYNPQTHEAPIVVGHPAHDAAAFGWVKGVRVTAGGDRLEVDTRQVDPTFAEGVKAGRYKKVSISLYKPTDPANPHPGKFSLRHVGFLGAMPPAVKGLKQVAFAGNTNDAVTIDFAASDFGGKLRAITDKFKSLLAGLSESPADAASLEAELEALTAEAEAEPAGAIDADMAAEVADEAASEVADALPSDLDPDMAAQIEDIIAKRIASALAAATPADHGERVMRITGKSLPPPRKTGPSADVVTREADLRRRELELRRNEHASFLESIVKEGRPLPAPGATIVTLLEALDTVRTDAVSFGENDTRAPVDVFKDTFLKRLKKQVLFEETAGAASFGEGSADSASDIARAATAYQAEQAKNGNHITTSEAVRHVEKKGT